jgi:two-component system nitrate/nitrite response regulator NarL
MAGDQTIHSSLSPEVQPMTGRVRLTNRERMLLQAVLDGCSNRRIAQRFGVKEQTVKNQLSVLFSKIGVASRLELAAYAVRHGLLERATERKKM